MKSSNNWNRILSSKKVMGLNAARISTISGLIKVSQSRLRRRTKGLVGTAAMSQSLVSIRQDPKSGQVGSKHEGVCCLVRSGRIAKPASKANRILIAPLAFVSSRVESSESRESIESSESSESIESSESSEYNCVVFNFHNF